MGSSPSKSLSANSSASSSKAQSPAGDGHRSSRTRHRTTTSTLNVPGSSSHRSRSANPRPDNASLGPPPPYSEAIDTSPSAAPTDPPGCIVRRSRSAQELPYQANHPSENIGHATTATGTTHSAGSRHTKVFTISEGQNIPRTAEYLQAPMRRESVENALETLRKYDTVIVVDDSSSMRGKRWKDVRTFALRLPIELTTIRRRPKKRYPL